jgi:hypothetical protein
VCNIQSLQIEELVAGKQSLGQIPPSPLARFVLLAVPLAFAVPLAVVVPRLSGDRLATQGGSLRVEEGERLKSFMVAGPTTEDASIQGFELALVGVAASAKG